MPMKELSMIITEKRFYSIRTICLKKTFKNTPLDSTFGSILQQNALKALEMTKAHSLASIEMFSKKSKVRNSRPSNLETIMNNK